MKKIDLEVNKTKSEMCRKVSGIFEKYKSLMQTDDAKNYLQAEEEFFNIMSSYFEKNIFPAPHPKITEEIKRDDSGFQLFLQRHFGTKSPDAEKLNEMVKEIDTTKKPYAEKIKNLLQMDL